MALAEFSPCKKYRYTLTRTLRGDSLDAPFVNFIMLNPSTATDVLDDPTIFKCTKFARRWGYAQLAVTNLFAFRATDPQVMKACGHPVGPENDKWIARMANEADLVIAAWGAHGKYLSRSSDVLKLLPVRPKILRLGKVEPWHPLYLPDATDPMPWDYEL